MPKKKIEPGNELKLSGGYDPEPAWLQGLSQRIGKAIKFIPGQNTEPALVVEFNEPFVYEGKKMQYGVLELRYRGAKWVSGAISHIVLCDFMPEGKSFEERRAGIWAESHVTIEVINDGGGNE